MQKKQSFVIKGMNRDVSASKLSSEYAYEIKNMRIFPTTENTLMSMVNEKGNKKATLSIKYYTGKKDEDGNPIYEYSDSIEGIPIGQATINDTLVLFCYGQEYEKTDEDGNPILDEEGTPIIERDDIIYSLEFSEEEGIDLTGLILYKGDLNFKVEYPIETIVYFENEDLQKVYWTDGINQPRMINIAATYEVRENWDNTTFDFVRTLELQEKVTIQRNETVGGLFAPGTLQYIFTYFDKYGQETNPFYISTLFYTSYIDRGGSPEDSVSNSFDIEIHNIQRKPKFDYVRIYSILRTSIDATPECRKVADLVPIEETNDEGAVDAYIIYTDTGTTGESADPTELLYVGGQQVTFGTMAQKDNTLFLGDIELKTPSLKDIKEDTGVDIKALLKGSRVDFFNGNGIYKELPYSEPKGYYSYEHQLKYSAEQIKTFKYLEWYRFGLIFQHKTGAWSDVVWLADLQNQCKIEDTFYTDSNPHLTIAQLTLDTKTTGAQDYTAIEALRNAGYVRVKPVIVYPDMHDRECICQGVLCPTMFNLADRYNNSPFVQSSWFARPNAPFSYDDYFQLSGPTNYRTGFNQGSSRDGGAGKEAGRDISKSGINWNPIIGDDIAYSRPGILLNDDGAGTNGNYDSDLDIDNVNKGTWAEFRHLYPIPCNINKRAEIQCITNPPTPTDLQRSNGESDITTNLWVQDNSENYYIDQSIFTLHSPDIEFDDQVQTLDSSGLKLRIVGIVPITATASDIDIQTSTPPMQFHEDYDDGREWAKQKNIVWSTEHAIGFYKENIGVENGFNASTYAGTSHFGWKGLMSGAFWLDENYGSSRSNKGHAQTAYVVYPWHRDGSLNNQPGNDSDGNRSAMLEKKLLSNLRYSYKSYYLAPADIWYAWRESDTGPNDGVNTGISGVRIFNSEEITLTKIPAPLYSELQDLNYYGNSDKLLTINILTDNNEDKRDTNSGELRSRGYPIAVTGRTENFEEEDEEGDDDRGTYNPESPCTHHELFRTTYRTLYTIQGRGCGQGSDKRYLRSEFCYGMDPVRIKYKSTPHAVMALNYNAQGGNIPRVLPRIASINSASIDHNDAKSFYWDKKDPVGVYQDSISPKVQDPETGEYRVVIPQEISEGVAGIQYGWLWLGELYNDNVANRFGGDTEEAIEQNTWVACGESVPLTLNENINIQWTEGDTYYQRYDHIKTYPFTTEDQNSIVDIISFMCETRVNLDGRYDRNRGLVSNLAITPENFNQVNKVYSQENNFYTYHTLNENLINLDNFHNSITWTKTKVAGDLVDTWTNITLASTLDLDGDKGSVNALRRYNNQLFAFQDTGISQIKYNENVQLAATEGVPVELANSGKVDGKNYITNQVGCTNKWSICETPGGLYFVDNLTKALYSFTDKLNNLTDTYGFSSWIYKELQDTSSWNPVDFNDFVTYYDRINNDVLLINKDNCLALSEVLGTFSSFYDYENTPYMANIGDKFLAIRKNDDDDSYSMWLQQEGDYNVFFDNYKPFWLTLIANDGMVTDKTFDNVEFRADTFDENGYASEETFDYLEARNEYQYGYVPLFDSKGHPAWIKKKFKIWRANIPRSTENRRDRIRSPWAYITLKKQSEDNHKTILHDVQVVYFDNTPVGLQTQRQQQE